MEEIIKPLLLIESFSLERLIEDYRLFFISLLPTIFVIAIIVEYFDRLEPFILIKRAFISILILTSVTGIYSTSINASFEAADSKIQEQRHKNIFLMDMLEANGHLENLQRKETKSFYKNRNVLSGTFAFFKYHMFDAFVNDGFTVTTFFIAKLCFIILKVVYSAVYYLGIGLIGIPCLIYLFPTMGNVLRGAVLSYIWCLIIPHILVFIISMIGAEINKGYTSGTIIGGSITGTAFLFILTLFIAFTPLIGAFILNGSGMAQAGGIIASIGANWVMNLPKNSVNTGASMIMGGPLGPKATIAKNLAKGGYKLAKQFKPNVSGIKSSFGSKTGFGTGMNDNGSSQSKTYGIGHNQIKGHLPPHTNDSEYVTLRNSNKRSGVDFISAPTRNSQAYSSSQIHEVKATSNNNKTRSSYNGEIPKHEQVNRRTQKTNYTNRDNRNRGQYNRSNNRNIPKPPSGRPRV